MNILKKLFSAVKRYDDTHHYTCDVCGREVFGGERVCNVCLAALPWNNGEICPFCGRKVREAGVCLECKEKPLKTDKARSVFTHDKEAARLVLRFKRGQKYLSRTLACLALPLVRGEFADAEALTFVPMTEKAKKRRGYNQSQLLAEELSALAGMPLIAAAEKRRETEEQKSLSRREREKNLDGCFRVTDRAAVKDKIILMVDDTMTTGATSSALAEALKKGGAGKVYLVTVTGVEKKTPFGKTPSKI